MTGAEFAAMRKVCGLTQSALSAHFGLSLRAVQDIEATEGHVKSHYTLALERVALNCAYVQANPMIAPPIVRKEALQVAGMITGGATVPRA
ncbi:hypothetical protein B5U98_08030 [Bosea sp. Tri-39]|nr:hypothetical protein BLM15_28810 [Bosea sp. Tri-49]RXT24910.1 hypothetical protein B5U98_08030 [Bosea sp. Tri-39]RXT33462.1 hypothetical protein B5U99_18460 [Bosea sp. Tri-54]